MPVACKTNEKTIVYRIAEIAFLFVVALYVFTIDITKTTMHLEMPDNKERYLFILFALTGLVRLAILLVEDKAKLDYWMGYIAVALAIATVYFMVYKETHNKSVMFLAIMTLGSIGIHYSRVLKAYIIAAVTVIFSAILMSWIGAIDNLVYIDGMTIRSSWGIKYPTDMMSLLFFLMLSIWVVSKTKGDIWFLVPGSILLLMSYYVAHSRTGTICFGLFIVALCIDYMIAHGSFPKLTKVINLACCAAFPLFAAITIVVFEAFRRGYSTAIRVDNLLSGRFNQTLKVLNEYGLSYFGKDIPQIGNGGSTFLKADYSFVDISYLLILFQYGLIALIVITIIWVFMTRKAVRIGDMRLALMLALIAFNAITEHHITQINYNILLATPFSIIAIKESVEKRVEPEQKKHHSMRYIFAALAFMVIITMITYCVIVNVLPSARSVTSLLELGKNDHRRKLLFVLCATAIWLTLLVLYSVGCMIFDQNLRKKFEAMKIRSTIFILSFIVVGVGVAICAGHVIKNSDKETKSMIEAEKDVIATILSTDDCDLYVTDYPSIYKKKYKKISKSLFYGEDLARFNHTAVIINRDLDSPVFFGSGFLYTIISDKHALYVKDYKTVKALEKKGYHFTSYYSNLESVDMQHMADLNDIQLEEGMIILNGGLQKLNKGPRKDLRQGLYTFNLYFDYEFLQDDNQKDNLDSNNSKACNIEITGQKGNMSFMNVELTNRDLYDSNGVITIECELPDTENVDIMVNACENTKIGLSKITYRKTPEIDFHRFYDADNRIYREESYDIEGKPFLGLWGYSAREIKYDNNNNNIQEIYYDGNNKRILNTEGYNRINRNYNDNHQVVREEYYDEKGKRTATGIGQFAVEYKYDGFGRQTEVQYLDVEDKEVDTVYGFSKIVRTYNEEGLLVKEEFFDNKGNYNTVWGYAIREPVYDENNNIIDYYFYNERYEKISGQ